MKILILEDDLTYLHILFDILYKVQKTSEFYYKNIFDITLFTSVSDIPKNIDTEKYDLVFLDRDSFDKKNFHDIINFWGNVVAISVISDYNNLAKTNGCKYIIPKTFDNYQIWYKDIENIIKHFYEKN
jgi:hypothetical protein